MIHFEWDELKNRINQAKHGISFEEASTVFYDTNAILFDDPSHSVKEDRFLILGISRKARTCIVSHCYRGEDEISVLSQQGRPPSVRKQHITVKEEY